jgi:hypothetical protein
MATHASRARKPRHMGSRDHRAGKLHSTWVFERELSKRPIAMFGAKARGIIRLAGVASAFERRCIGPGWPHPGEGFRMPAGAGRGSGRGPAYENRPSTNPRACGAGLRGFRVLAERDDGGVGSAMAPTGTRRVRLCSRRSVEPELVARDVHAFSRFPGERRAGGGRRNNGHCGVG